MTSTGRFVAGLRARCEPVSHYPDSDRGPAVTALVGIAVREMNPTIADAVRLYKKIQGRNAPLETPEGELRWAAMGAIEEHVATKPAATLEEVKARLEFIAWAEESEILSDDLLVPAIKQSAAEIGVLAKKAGT